MKTIESLQVDKVTFLKKAVHFAVSNMYGIAIWKNPLTTDYFVSINTEKPHKGKIEVEKASAGFCFSPFENEQLQETLFFESTILYKIENNDLKGIKGDSEFEDSCITNTDNPLPLYFTENEATCTLKSDYLDAVVCAKREIETTSLKKVIVSKTKTQQRLPESDVIIKFLEISSHYPNAFASFISTPETGTWMGASPEILISLDRNNQFKTVALAGTQPYNSSEDIKNAVWSQKEIEEQALVSRYITLCLKSIRLREYEDFGPKTVKTGNLLHLKTEFYVNTSEDYFPNLGSQMLELLHPTSAVCGMPKEQALAFIKKYEKHNRSYYSGFLGPVNIENETTLFVNLRCVEFTKNQLVFYAGAGITEDSDPEKEWEETEQKCAILGTLFNK